MINPETCKVRNLGDFEFIDHGRDIYATQSCEDEEGRRVMVDPNVIEIFVDDGKYCLTNAVYHLGEKLEGKVDKVFVSSENY